MCGKCFVVDVVVVVLLSAISLTSTINIQKLKFSKI